MARDVPDRPPELLTRTLQFRAGNYIFTLVTEVRTAVLTYADILANVRVDAYSGTDAPYENQDGYEHRVVKDELPRADLSEMAGYLGRGQVVVLDPDEDFGLWQHWRAAPGARTHRWHPWRRRKRDGGGPEHRWAKHWLRRPPTPMERIHGCLPNGMLACSYCGSQVYEGNVSKQVAFEKIAAARRQTIQQIVAWRRDGWTYWEVCGTYLGQTAALHDIDDFMYADTVVRREIADELVDALEEKGYTVTGKPDADAVAPFANKVENFIQMVTYRLGACLSAPRLRALVAARRQEAQNRGQ